MQGARAHHVQIVRRGGPKLEPGCPGREPFDSGALAVFVSRPQVVGKSATPAQPMKKPAGWKAKAGYQLQSALAVFLTRPQAVYLKSAQLNYAIFVV